MAHFALYIKYPGLSQAGEMFPRSRFHVWKVEHQLFQVAKAGSF